jgi:uncharacterized membrane protein
MLGLGLLCLMPHSVILQLYHGGQFYWWRKPEDLEETINLSQVTDKIFWRKIVIFHTKYPKKFPASLRSAQFF